MSEFSEDYRKGFEDAKHMAVEACMDCADYDLRAPNSQATQAVAERVQMATPESFARWIADYEELNHRKYERRPFQRVIRQRSRW